MKNLIIIFLLALLFVPDSQAQCDVEFYLDLTGKQEFGNKLDPKTTQLDSLIIEPNDITSVNTHTLSFKLTKEAAARLRSMSLNFKVFTLVINDEPVLAGWFWGCYSSLGADGYVTFNLDCGDSDEIKIIYSLPRQDLPNTDLIKETCANKI